MTDFNKKFIYFICFVSALGGLLFGYDWVVIGGAKPFYEVFFGITDNPVQQGWAMSIAIAGCLVGATTAGKLADLIGRKWLLMISSVIFLISAYGTGEVSNYDLFLFYRLIGGVAIGVASMVSPMYIAEISPAHIRGKLVSINQLTIVIGILAAQIVNYLIAEPLDANTTQPAFASWNCQLGWRWMFWAEAFPAALFFIMSFFIPESPRWLILKKRADKALEVLAKIGDNGYAHKEIEAQQKNDGNRKQGNLATLFSKPYRRVLILGLIVAVFQQWCGTNVIFNYAQEIFEGAGYDVSETLFNIVLTGITNLVFTFVAIFTVERLGRRTLMLIGAGGLAVTYLLLGAGYFFGFTGIGMVLLVVIAIACYAMTLGPVTWVLLSEIFPDRVRAVAMATCTFALWAACFLLTYSFPILNSWLGSYGTFWIYAAICIFGYIFFTRRLPETKGESLEELEKKLID
ncbi:MAG: sugar porter family MFS transporter [Muribaculaceae bacterium]|nr:sugar porter family MFS transporter [Muribaculaceae bacterium]